MPKEITHCILAERAAHTMAASTNKYKKLLGGEIYFLFEKYPELLYFGSVAPDIFFYDIALPWEFRIKHRGLFWGELIHGTDGENSLAHVLEMLEILKSPLAQRVLIGDRALNRDEHDALLLFTLGYLTHVALDTVMHPIVYYYAGNYYAKDRAEKLRAEARHRAIETVLDLYNLAWVGSNLKNFRALNKIVLPAKWRSLVLSFYTLSIVRAWPETTTKEFGHFDFETQSVLKHPLYRVALRGYKKQMFFNRVFQNLQLARWGLWFNRARHDSLHFHSSLLYPAVSYAEYQKDNRGERFSIGDLKHYRNPLDDSGRPIVPERLAVRALSRSHAFFRAAYLYSQDKISRSSAENILRGYSLNNGRVGVATNQMKFFAPLAINGNFEYVTTRGGTVGARQDGVLGADQTTRGGTVGTDSTEGKQ